MTEDLGERTEEPTPKRWKDARAEGNVAKSQDLAGAIALLLITVAIGAASMHLLSTGQYLLDAGLRVDASLDVMTAAVRMALPILVIAWLAAAGSVLIQIGWVFAPKTIQPQLRKINPILGLKRIFGLPGLVRSGIDTTKVFIVIAIALLTGWQYRNEIVTMPYLSSLQAMYEGGLMVFDLALRALGAMIALGVVDLMYQRWKHRRDLRMTKQQVKDELKHTEGDPDVKRRRNFFQRQLAMQRITSAVPKANVIITNPEHVSIAVAYDETNMRAPKVIAKGADYLAIRIRLIAMTHGIPIVERKPIARALYKHVKVNQEIPPTLYKVVAEILAYVYRLNERKTA